LAPGHHINGVFAADIMLCVYPAFVARIFWKSAPVRCFPGIFA
jgi:hypothetical protein